MNRAFADTLYWVAITNPGTRIQRGGATLG
jgi:hypothetical protein